MLPEVIHPSQTAYMQGRFLGTNIHKVQDAINWAESQNTKCVALFLDFQKAFDSVSHVFLWSLLTKMGFPQDFVSWTMLLHSQVVSKIRNAGWMSTCFSLHRGVHQGCPLSCHLFNLVSQVTIYYLQKCGHFLWWILVGDPNSMYADNIALILECLEKVPGVLADLKHCSEFMGLSLNLNKMVVFDQNCCKNYHYHGITVTSDPMKYLGTYVGARNSLVDKKLDHLVSKMKCTAQKWRHHSMSLFARVVVFKSMIFSQIIHMLNTSYILIKTVEFLQKFANDFLWRGKTKVNTETVQN